MTSIFFAPRGEASPVKTHDKIRGRIIVGKFLGNVQTPSYIGWKFEVFPIKQPQVSKAKALTEDPSQWAEVRQAG